MGGFRDRGHRKRLVTGQVGEVGHAEHLGQSQEHRYPGHEQTVIFESLHP
jgi:hypothetical protein